MLVVRLVSEELIILCHENTNDKEPELSNEQYTSTQQAIPFGRTSSRDIYTVQSSN